MALAPGEAFTTPEAVVAWSGEGVGFDEPKLLEIATTARDLGVEMFVLDDGCFGERDDDTSSLGGWVVDRRKLPNGG